MPEIMRILRRFDVPRERMLLVVSYLSTVDAKADNYIEAAHTTQALGGSLTESVACCLVLNAIGCYPLTNFCER